MGFEPDTPSLLYCLPSLSAFKPLFLEITKLFLPHNTFKMSKLCIFIPLKTHMIIYPIQNSIHATHITHMYIITSTSLISPMKYNLYTAEPMYNALTPHRCYTLHCIKNIHHISAHGCHTQSLLPQAST